MKPIHSKSRIFGHLHLLLERNLLVLLEQVVETSTRHQLGHHKVVAGSEARAEKQHNLGVSQFAVVGNR